MPAQQLDKISRIRQRLWDCGIMLVQNKTTGSITLLGYEGSAIVEGFDLDKAEKFATLALEHIELNEKQILQMMNDHGNEDDPENKLTLDGFDIKDRP